MLTQFVSNPTLFIFAGLPGTGKTTIARQLAQRINAVYLRIDTVEQALRQLCHIRVEGEGYRLSYRVAADNLRLGMDVVADSCNPIVLTRREWEQVAEENGATFVNIEIVCSDRVEHEQRIVSRRANAPGSGLPTWRDVETREYHNWSQPRITIDTAGKPVADCVDALMLELASRSGGILSHPRPNLTPVGAEVGV